MSKFVTGKSVKPNDLSIGEYSVVKNTRFKTPMVRSNLCDSYIAVKGTVDLLAAVENNKNKAEKEVQFKNNAPFRSCIPKTKNTLIDNAEDLDIVMSMYNLLEQNHNYSMKSGSLQNYFRERIDDVDVNKNASDGKSFQCNGKIVGEIPERFQ